MSKQYWRHFALMCVFACGVAIAGQGNAAAQEAKEQPRAQPAETRKPTETRQPTAEEHENWRKAILKTPRPAKNKCYTAKYPDKEWSEVPCKTPPHKLYPPRGTGHAQQVGNGVDFSAIPASGFISETEGSFDTSSNINSECDVPCTTTMTGIVCPTNPSCTGSFFTNSYSLQLNSKPFSSTSACSSSPNGNTPPNGCLGWEQFVYSASGTGFIQYWLEQWGPPSTSPGFKACPAPHGTDCAINTPSSTGWCEVPLYGQTYCVANAVAGTNPISEPIRNLDKFIVTAYAAGGSMTTDSLAVSVKMGATSTAPGNNYFPDLGSKWTEAEFNVFGDGNGSQAVFNTNASLTVRVGELSGTSLGPTCDAQSFTGESNNLTLVNTTSNPAKENMPALVFTEANVGGTPAACSSAISLGDTHIHPFNGDTEYDFQAYGDFLLVEAGPDFMVHTRQVPGPPGYPGTSINTAVAVMMGRTRVAVYLQPARLVIDGKTNNLADGKTIALPTGVLVTHKGAEYAISDESGNIVRADLVKNGTEPLWMNITVGLGRSPDSRVRGLLGNPGDKMDEIKTARGAFLKVPVDVKDLYGQFADSWRVDPAKSLFVELPRAQAGTPAKPLTAKDLDPADKAHAIEVCKAAGITHEALLDDCVLDTTVLKDDAAVKIFTRVAPPKLVIKPVAVVERK